MGNATIKLTIGFVVSLVLGAAAGATAQTRYEKVKSFMTELTQQYAATTSQIDIGLSDSGERILGLRIGNGPVKNLLVATHHGNEYGSTEVAKAFAADLAKAPIDGQTIYVIPVLNIAGYNTNDRYERTAATSRRYDPNRNYPGPCGTEGPFTLKSTQAIAELIDKENVVNSATLHTHYPAVVYPWGMSTHDTTTGYETEFMRLVNLASQFSKYATGNSTDVIYPADGTFEDYAYWKHGIWSLLYELGYSHSPTPSAVAELIRVNVPGLRLVFENSPKVRAPDHEFKGRCDRNLKTLDRHDE